MEKGTALLALEAVTSSSTLPVRRSVRIHPPTSTSTSPPLTPVEDLCTKSQIALVEGIPGPVDGRRSAVDRAVADAIISIAIAIPADARPSLLLKLAQTMSIGKGFILIRQAARLLHGAEARMDAMATLQLRRRLLQEEMARRGRRDAGGGAGAGLRRDFARLGRKGGIQNAGEDGTRGAAVVVVGVGRTLGVGVDFGDDVLGRQGAHEAVTGFVAGIVGWRVVVVVEGMAWWGGWDVLVVVVVAVVGTFLDFGADDLVDHVVHCCVHGCRLRGLVVDVGSTVSDG